MASQEASQSSHWPSRYSTPKRHCLKKRKIRRARPPVSSVRSSAPNATQRSRSRPTSSSTRGRTPGSSRSLARRASGEIVDNRHFEHFNETALLNRNFVSKWVLRAHQITHDRSGGPKFQCAECKRSFSTRGTLNRHMACHSESRPFVCPYCYKTFKTYAVCKKHVKTHMSEVLHMVLKFSFQYLSMN